jgi:hypothetical protein
MGKYFVYAIGLVLIFAPRLRADVTLTNDSPDLFAAAVSDMVDAGGGTIFVTTPILVTDDMDEPIDGGSVVTVSGRSTNSIFNVESGSLVLANMTLENGFANLGGAMFIDTNATVTLTNCIFSHNQAHGTNGVSADSNTNSSSNQIFGKSGGRGTAGSSAYGGAVFNYGDLTILNCKFITNSAVGGIGGDGADGESAGSKGGDGGRGGAGGGASGGGIFNFGSLVVSNSTFSGNLAQGGAGGVGGAGGGGIIPGANGFGGASGIAAGGGLYTADLDTALIANSTFDRNTVQGGDSPEGGNGNSGLGQNGPRGGNALGGGVNNSGLLMVVNSTFFQNKALGGSGGDGGSSGARGGNGGAGGNAIGGGIYNASTVTVLNCTFSKGNAVGGTNGAAGSGAVSGQNGKRGSSFGGNIANVAKKKAGSFQLSNSILAPALSGGAGYGTIIDGGYNISADKSIKLKKSGLSLMNTNPLVGDLGDNGGPTQTIPLKPKSPAIDFVPPQLAPPFDQRGPEFPRPVGAASDAGAFELDTNRVTILTNPLSTNAIIGSNVTFTVAASGLGPLFYHWYFNSNLLSGAISNSLSITNVQLTNAGNYFVIVSNTINSATSAVAVLTVTNFTNPTNSAPNITQQPTNSQGVLVGSTVSISVTATGTAPLAYQWFFQAPSASSATNLIGATNNVLTIPNAQTNNSGTYVVLVANVSGSVTSSPSVLSVTNPTSIDLNPGAFLRLKGVSPAIQMVVVPKKSSRSAGVATNLEMGSAPASGAVSRASRLTQRLEFRPPLNDFARLSVRREARRTAAGAAALPRTQSVPAFYLMRRG